MIRYDAFTKIFDRRCVVDSLTVTIPPGTVVALLGPNGSGKTTSLKAAAGLLAPSSGRVLLGNDAQPASDPVARRRCSFLPQRAAFPETLTGREVVEFYRRLRGADVAAADRALKLAALNGSGNRIVGSYSGGMLQRLGLAVAMVPDTDVLLLDEPTAALDPDGLRALYAVIEERRRSGAAILFSSHQLGDVERLADRIAILVSGRLVAMLTQRELAAALANRGVMRVRLAAPVGDVISIVRRVSPGAIADGDELLIPGPATSRPAALDAIREAGAEISGLMAEEGRLDDLYRELVEAHP